MHMRSREAYLRVGNLRVRVYHLYPPVSAYQDQAVARQMYMLENRCFILTPFYLPSSAKTNPFVSQSHRFTASLWGTAGTVARVAFDVPAYVPLNELLVSEVIHPLRQ